MPQPQRPTAEETRKDPRLAIPNSSLVAYNVPELRNVDLHCRPTIARHT
jgi:hypothetical protein